MRPVPIIRSATPADADGIAALWLQLNQTGELVDDRYLLKHDVDTETATDALLLRTR